MRYFFTPFFFSLLFLLFTLRIFIVLFSVMSIIIYTFAAENH